MSAEATFWAWMMGVKPAACKLVLLCLADCHNADNGRCDPGGGYIAEFTGLDKKTIPDCLLRLELMGLITPRKRAGNSTQYHLHIEENPVPTREKGERKKAVPFDKVDLTGHARKRVHPKTGMVQPGGDAAHTQKRVHPESGTPKNGYTRNSQETPPENGEGVYPKTGHEPTKNLPVKPTSYSDPDGSAPGGAHAVDNSLKSIGEDYRSESCEQLLFNRGARFLGEYGIAADKARTFLGMCKRESGPGRTMDALITAILSRPAGDPKAFILGVLANPEKPIDNTWEPDAAVVAELEGLGIPTHLVRRARETFVTWFRSMEIYHTDWPRLFRDWVIRDWEAAEFKEFQYRRWLAESAGFAYDPTFKEPA